MMKIAKLLPTTALAMLLAAGLAPETASAQEHARGGHHGSSHSDRQQRESQALRQGRGMGMARAAETNGYPGPMHVLALAEELELSDEQVARSNEIRNRVRDRAPAMGQQIIEAEQRLEAMFAEDRAAPAEMEALLMEIAGLRARLRGLHLNAHLEQAEVLSAEQIEQYMELRHSGEEQGERGRGERKRMRRHQGSNPEEG